MILQCYNPRHFAIILGSFWDHFGMILGSFWGSELPWTPSDAGGRVVGSHQISQQKQAN